MKRRSDMSSYVFLKLGLFVGLGSSMVFGALVSSSSAQVITLEPGQKEPNFDIHYDRNTPRKLEFTVVPRAEPDMPLEYRFWIDPNSRKPGSVAARIFRAIHEHERLKRNLPRSFWIDAPYPLSLEGKREPIATLDIARSRAFVDKTRRIISELHEAITLDGFDEVIRLRDIAGPDILDVTLNELQELRSLTRILVVDIRLAVAEHRYSDAERSIQAAFKLSEAAERCWQGSLVSKLISVAIAGITYDAIGEMMQQSDAPNFYWAIATIPEHSSNNTSGLLLDLQFSEQALNSLLDLPRESITEEAWRDRVVVVAKDIARLLVSVESTKSVPSDEWIQMNAACMVLLHADHSRAVMKAAGVDPEALQQMSDSEVVIRATARQVHRLNERQQRLAFLPPELQIDRSYSKHFGLAKPVSFDIASQLSDMLFADAEQIGIAELRVRAQRNRLLTIAAIQASLAENESVWPKSLEHLSPLPAWDDPVTKKPFKIERLSDRELIVESAQLYPNLGEDTTRLSLIKSN